MFRFLRTLLVEAVNLIFAVLIAVLIFLALRYYVLQPFQVDGLSMHNTLIHGDQLLMFKQADIERFDVVVFPDPRGSEESYVKRIIGLPGDHIAFSQDQLFLNGEPVDEPYLEPVKSEADGLFTQDFDLWEITGDDIIPAGYYFVMGDNRPYSGDSRQFGYVAIDAIQGEANLIYYPFDRIGNLDQYALDENYQIQLEE